MLLAASFAYSTGFTAKQWLPLKRGATAVGIATDNHATAMELKKFTPLLRLGGIDKCLTLRQTLLKQPLTNESEALTIFSAKCFSIFSTNVLTTTR